MSIRGLDPSQLERFAEPLPRLFYALLGLAFLATVFGSPGTGLLLLMLGGCAHVARVGAEALRDGKVETKPAQEAAEPRMDVEPSSPGPARSPAPAPAPAPAPTARTQADRQADRDARAQRRADRSMRPPSGTAAPPSRRRSRRPVVVEQ